MYYNNSNTVQQENSTSTFEFLINFRNITVPLCKIEIASNRITKVVLLNEISDFGIRSSHGGVSNPRVCIGHTTFLLKHCSIIIKLKVTL